MLTRLTVIAAMALAAIVAIAGSARAEIARWRLVWTDDPTRTATFVWEQASGENPQIHYGTEDHGTDWTAYPNAMPPSRVNPYRGMNNHFAQFTGLEPDSRVYFVVRDSEGVSARLWFRTAPDSPEPFTCVMGGDTKSSGDPLAAGRYSNKLVAKLRPLFVLFSGDFCSGDGTDDERWRIWLHDWARQTTTPDGRLIPIVPVIGNHEGGDLTVLHNLFGAPYQSGDAEHTYYSLSLGGGLWHMIALNSQIDEGGAQRAWLEADLAAHKDDTFKIAAYHKPFRPHTESKSENDYQYDQWAQLFYDYGLDIAAEADSHMSKITWPLRPDPEGDHGFVRDDTRGTMFIGEGSWGAAPRDNNDDKQWTMRSGSFNQFKWLHVHPAMGDQPARIEIRTVMSAWRDAEGRLVSGVEGVESLTEDNVFAIPAGISLFSTPETGDAVVYSRPAAAAVGVAGSTME